MSANYCEAFTKKYGADDSGIWQTMLIDLTEKELQNGMDKWREGISQFAEFPPSPLQFKLICQDKKYTEEPEPACHKFYEPDPTPPNPNRADWASMALAALAQVEKFKPMKRRG